MTIIGIDPGTTHSAFVVWNSHVSECGFLANSDLLARIKDNHFGGAELLGVEMVESFGMAVGKETFETVYWIGRFCEASRIPFRRVFRKEIKLHLCNSHRAKDKNIRQALIDKHGKPGTNKNRGLLYGISGHCWSAMAVCDFCQSNSA